MKRRHLVKGAVIGAIAATMLGGAATAQEVTLRMHQFLPPQATLPGKILDPWARSVEEASDGRIKIEHFYAMSLGGRPPELMDQARDGVVDIAMTLPGYTPGRFPSVEVFELPFMMTDPVATAKAYWELVDTQLQDSEFADVHILGAWVHGPGMIHSKEPVASLEDMSGKTLRGPTRVINDLLSELGAEPVGMPVPAIPEALSKGVVGGTVIPWEVTPALRLTELVGNHTEFSGEESLYTATFVLAMNKAKYDAMPDDLKAILDAESGAKLSALASETMLAMDAPAREVAVNAGNNIITLDETEVARWKDASQAVI
ncbi:MAG: TRAP transporter substrate-binding protein, partial [Pseudomonadota bacterium]